MLPETIRCAGRFPDAARTLPDAAGSPPDAAGRWQKVDFYRFGYVFIDFRDSTARKLGRPVAGCGILWHPVAACGGLWRPAVGPLTN